MQMVSVPFTVQLEMTKLFNLLKIENGSAQSLSPTQNMKFPSCKLVNDGKLRYFGNAVKPVLEKESLRCVKVRE
jgi:hypothetical protein